MEDKYKFVINQKFSVEWILKKKVTKNAHQYHLL